MPNYRIEMWSFSVSATGGAGRHNFLVLVDGNGQAIRELHGGAAGPNGTLSVTALSGTLFVKEGIVGGAGTYGQNPVASTGSNFDPTARREYVVQEGPRPTS